MSMARFYMDFLQVDEETAKSIIEAIPFFYTISHRTAIHDPQIACDELAKKYPQREKQFYQDNIGKLIFAFNKDSNQQVIAEVNAFFKIKSAIAIQGWQKLCKGTVFTIEEFRAVVERTLPDCKPSQITKKMCGIFDVLWEKELIVEETYLGV